MANLKFSTVILFVVIVVVTVFINSASSQPLAKWSRTGDYGPSHRLYTRSVEQCTSTCSKLQRPVCGSDGVTYSNPCQFKECGKKHNPNLQISRQGPC